MFGKPWFIVSQKDLNPRKPQKFINAQNMLVSRLFIFVGTIVYMGWMADSDVRFKGDKIAMMSAISR